jgi:hypothetical protein
MTKEGQRPAKEAVALPSRLACDRSEAEAWMPESVFVLTSQGKAFCNATNRLVYVFNGPFYDPVVRQSYTTAHAIVLSGNSDNTGHRQFWVSLSLSREGLI